MPAVLHRIRHADIQDDAGVSAPNFDAVAPDFFAPPMNRDFHLFSVLLFAVEFITGGDLDIQSQSSPSFLP
ncbi:MAG: hypothetical protein R3C05_09555 [Pirellulaceae bacterium]